MGMDDASLAAVIADAGLTIAPAELRTLLERVAASGERPESTAWIELLLADPSPLAVRRLQEARASIVPVAEPWSRARIDALFAVLARENLAGFVLPLADEHLGEFMPGAARRLSWLTGFSGSAGTAILHRETAALFVDGRYTLQAEHEVDGGAIEVRHFKKPPPLDWLAGRLTEGERIGYDPRLHAVRQADSLVRAIEAKGAIAVALAQNPVDEVWTRRPPLPLSPVVPHPLEFAGVSSDDKIEALGRELTEAGVAAAVISQLDAIAWLLNLRGGDTANTPLVGDAYALVHASGQADFFVEPAKVTARAAAHLGNRIATRDIAGFPAALAHAGADGAGVLVDPDRTNAFVRDTLVAAGARIVAGTDPTLARKARKNPVEIAGIRAAHERDGVAVALFLKWVTETAPVRAVTELDAVAELDRLRARNPRYRGTSFDTIAGSGPNGAIVHYRPQPSTNRRIGTGELLLVDSGAQYLDGTTDITRTVAIGEPPAAARRDYTLVLKAHIAVARAVFPQGTVGGQIDVLARQHLWAGGLDYDHGTGHGVGAYLGVHEGPQRLAVGDTTVLEAGMLISNEPGLYKTGEYGIRTENLVLVRDDPDLAGFRSFETVTFAPMDRRLIDVALLEPNEIAWLDAYHAKVRAVLEPQMPAEARAWLGDATAPLP
jgi:Xaa-Pro aminopeptidase